MIRPPPRSTRTYTPVHYSTLFRSKEGNNSNLTSRTRTLLADSGLDNLKAAFIGPKGKERLIGVVRQTEYAAGKEPPIPVVVSAIEQKYGDFDTQENSPGQTPEYEGIRLFSPGGQRLAEDNTDYRKCMSKDRKSTRLNSSH